MEWTRSSYHQLQSGSPWRTGVLKHIPWLGLSALFSVLLCIVTSAVVLISSNGKRVDTWPTKSVTVQPAVLLAVLSALTNTLLRYSLQEGCTIAWWHKVTNGGNVADLHRYWAYGTSSKASVTSGRHFNKVALACLLTTLVVIDGPLLQRASTSRLRPTPTSVTMSVSLSPDPLPIGFSGVYMTRAGNINQLTPAFAQILRDFTSRSAIQLQYKGCDGTCDTIVTAPGFDTTCTTTTVPYNITLKPGYDYNVGSLDIGFNGLAGNGKSPGVSGNIEVSTSFKPDPGCVGNLVATKCSLQVSKVRYPVTISNGSATLPARSASINDTVEVQYPYYETAGLGVWPSTIGGIAFAMQTMHESNVSLYSTGVLASQGSGPMGSMYLNSSQETYGGCNMTWADPTPDILANIRELIFRSAVSVSNATTLQTVPATDTAMRTFYLSDYRFLLGAITLMALNTCVLVPLFLGWWQLGRAVSLSPVETAKAFRAPLLRDSDCNADVDGLLAEVGHRRARYGTVAGDEGMKSSGASLVQEAWVCMEEMGERGRRVRQRLEVADSRVVSAPVGGAVYRD